MKRIELPVDDMRVLFIYLSGPGTLIQLGIAQFVCKIKSDSVQVANGDCNAELIIKNGTRSVPGFCSTKETAGRNFAMYYQPCWKCVLKQKNFSPRMTTTMQRDAITSLAEDLMIYNTTTKSDRVITELLGWILITG